MKLEIKNISYQYNKGGRKKDSRMLLEDFSLEMDSKERLGISAPSGYGKTTLCKLMAGYLKPVKGEICLDGRTLDSYKGYCPVQMIWQHPELSVNPRMKMKDVLLEGDRVEERVIHALGIKEEWMNRFPCELSGGELQRFCIARALGEGTRFLLADEITTMLDLITQSEIWSFLIEETKKGKSG